ncbi:methyl-accepting chemotaxis protein [Microcoleus sp. CAWBG58]|uniref:HAMP domain-containing methyl-accepting chemotaxis protein n=1 Tax=Microcoleus sp. CAWBG58 TaxID=2841651 RepID=UPI0025EDD80F|nr:methyl-accepting chemotaxis protein [Microcoleus sp. CAWBG58]
MNLGIRAKLLASFGALTALLAVVGFVGWRNTVELAQDAEKLYAYQVKGTVALANSESALWKLRYGFPQFIVLPSKRSDILTEEPQLYKIIDDNLREYAKGELTPEEQVAFGKVQDAYQRYIAARPKWFELQQAGKLKEAEEYRAATTTPFGAETVQAFSTLIQLQRKVGETKHQEIEANIQGLTVLLVCTLSFALLSAAVLTAIVSRDIVNPIVESVKKIVSSSMQITAAVDRQEYTISQQVNAVNQTTATMNELSVASSMSAKQAEASAVSSHQALTLAESGNESVEKTMKGIVTLQEKVDAIAKQITYLNENTVKISGISDLVADLANQTNMLALNAAVEAVRAGENGKGFAVVATEIRRLADESKQSADKINVLTKEIQVAIGYTVTVTDEGAKTAAQGIIQARGTTEIFAGVAEAVDKVFLNNQQIALNANQQAIAIEQVLAAMNHVNLGATETASSLAQVKVSTELLNQTAAELNKMA